MASALPGPLDQSKDTDLVRVGRHVGGEWIAEAARLIDVDGPATGQVIARLPDLPSAAGIQAMDAAQAAFSAWRARPAKERARMLRAWFGVPA